MVLLGHLRLGGYCVWGQGWGQTGKDTCTHTPIVLYTSESHCCFPSVYDVTLVGSHWQLFWHHVERQSHWEQSQKSLADGQQWIQTTDLLGVSFWSCLELFRAWKHPRHPWSFHIISILFSLSLIFTLFFISEIVLATKELQTAQWVMWKGLDVNCYSPCTECDLRNNSVDRAPSRSYWTWLWQPGAVMYM